ncbi:MAG: riboflavin synthase [Candidatus Dormibacteria bacterium]
MFSGIVEGLGVVRQAPSRSRADLVLELPEGWAQPELGESVAVNGCCLTVVEAGEGRLRAELTPETRRRTTLGRLRAGQPVNLEASLALGQRVGGHLVSGHVDATGQVAGLEREGNATWLQVEIPGELARYCVPRGSIAIDGCSLTLCEVAEDAAGARAWVRVSLIPHTCEHTVAGRYREGERVNVEVDSLARLVERLVGPHPRHPEAGRR